MDSRFEDETVGDMTAVGDIKVLLSKVLHLHYIYIYAFSRRFYPKRLTIAFRLYISISTCVPWELTRQEMEDILEDVVMKDAVGCEDYNGQSLNTYRAELWGTLRVSHKNVQKQAADETTDN